MQALRIKDNTRVLAETQDEFSSLAIKDEVIDGYHMMTTVWEPTPKELAELVAGGAVKLTILGTLHPPVLLTTQPAPE